MTLDQIKSAVDAGKSVHWSNEGYLVHRDALGQYLITFQPNAHSIGLTDRSETRLNGAEDAFFVSRPDLGETLHCSDCSSEDVQRDCWAAWNAELQTWEVVSVHDHAWCNTCQGEVKLTTRPIRDYGVGHDGQAAS